METDVAALEVQVSVVLPPGVMVVELAAKVTVGAELAGVAGAAVPVPHPPKANRAAKQIKTVQKKRRVFIGAILQANLRQSAESELPNNRE
jgi:hypothetical protein